MLITPQNNLMLLRPEMSVNVAFQPSPFGLEVISHCAQPGQSIADILRNIPELPPEIWSHGVAFIGEWEIPRAHWARVKPKPGARYMVRVGVRLADGGGGGGGKSLFATIAAIALVVAATAISGGVLGPGGALSISSSLFAAGSTSAALAAAGISVVGALAINALLPTAAPENKATDDGGTVARLGSASAGGNVIGMFEPIPFVMGTHRVSPPHIIPPWAEAVNDDEFVYAIFGLNGAHEFSDIRINNASIDDIPDIEYEIRDVVNDDTDLTLITNQVYENPINAELVGHKVKDDATDELQDETTPANSYPQWVTAKSRHIPDEIWLKFFWTTLINQESSGGVNPGGTAIRIRIRRAGDSDWINLPEFHAQRERLEPFRGVIKLLFAEAPSSLTRLDQNQSLPPWKYALDVDDSDNDEGFVVDSYFAASVGNNADNVGSQSGVAVVYLDPATFIPGTYDVQVMRGAGYKSSDFSASTYTYSSNTPYFFSHVAGSSPPDLRREQSKVPAKISLQSVASVWNEYPLGEKGMSLLALKAKNLAVNSVSLIAKGFANVWDGTDWDGFTATSNPAAWWRYLALGGQSVEPTFVSAQFDNDALVEWFDFCDGGGEDISTDFAGETLASPPSGFTSRWESGSTANVTAEAALPSGRGPLFDRTSTDGRSFWSYDALGQIRDVDLVALIRPVSGDASTESMGVIVRGSGAAASETGYRLNFASSVTDERDEIALGKYVAGSFTAIIKAAFAWALDENYYVRFRVVGSRLRAKVWAEADDEPLEWLIDEIDTDISGAGYVGPFVFRDNESFYLGSIQAKELGMVHECNAYISGRRSLSEIMRIVAATGFASGRVSDKVGVIIEQDRSSESPIELFTQRNSQGLEIRRAFPRIPNGFRVTFNDAENDYQPKEIFVYRDPSNLDNIESIEYLGLTSEAEVIERIYLDFNQLLRRAALYNLKTDIQHLYCTKGSLVALAHDTLKRHYDSARALSASISGGNLTALALDSAVRLSFVDDYDGEFPAGVLIQLKDGTTLTAAVDETADSASVTFTTPQALPDYLSDEGAWATSTAYAIDDVVANDGAAYSCIVAHTSGAASEPGSGADWLDYWEPLLRDCLVASGPFASVEKRMLVLGIKPESDMTAALTLVDEAPPVLLYSDLLDNPAEQLFSEDNQVLIAPF